MDEGGEGKTGFRRIVLKAPHSGPPPKADTRFAEYQLQHVTAYTPPQADGFYKHTKKARPMMGIAPFFVVLRVWRKAMLKLNKV